MFYARLILLVLCTIIQLSKVAGDCSSGSLGITSCSQAGLDALTNCFTNFNNVTGAVIKGPFCDPEENVVTCCNRMATAAGYGYSCSGSDNVVQAECETETSALSHGAIAGIVVGSIAFLIALSRGL